MRKATIALLQAERRKLATLRFILYRVTAVRYRDTYPYAALDNNMSPKTIARFKDKGLGEAFVELVRDRYVQTGEPYGLLKEKEVEEAASQVDPDEARLEEEGRREREVYEAGFNEPPHGQ